MRKTKKALASLAIAGMVLSLAPMSVFGATTTDRLAGAGRVDTAINIAASGWTASDSVIVVPADDANIVDALAAAPLAGQLNAPILITYKGALDPKVQQKIVDLKAKNVYAIGALSDDAVNSLKAISGVAVTALKGADRTETAALVSAKLTNVKGSFVVAYNGEADALSAASFAAANGYSIVVANPDGTIPANEAAYKVAPTYTVGGQVSVTGATALKGADRYATNDAVVNGLTYTYDKVYVANGETLVDALAGAPLAAQTKSPIVLADATKAATGVNDNLTATSEVIALGGSGAVSDSVLGQVAYQVPATLAVQSVSAINADQLQVVFNTTVNKTSAESIGNYYSVNAAGVATALAAPSVATLQADNKTVIITLDPLAKLVNKGAYAFRVSGVTDPAGKVADDFTASFIASDKTAPTLVSATATAKASTNTITLTFSEPVDTSVASVTVNGTFAALTAGTGAKSNQVTVTTGSSLMAGTTYNLNVMNFQDFAANFIATNPLAATVTVQADTVAPNLVSAVINSDSQLELTFDKAMEITTLTAGINVKLLDSNLGATAGVLGAAVAKDSTNKVFDFAISGTTGWNSSNVMSSIVALTSSVADKSGNTLTALTQNISFTKQTTAPALVSASYKNVTTYGTTAVGAPIATTNGAIVFKYNGKVVAGAAPSTVINDQGSTVAGILGVPVVNNSDKTELVVPLTGPVASGTVSYMILLPTGMVTDSAQTANSSVAINQIVNVSAGATVAGDTTAPVVTATPTVAAQVLGSDTVITVNYTEAGTGLDLNTVVNTNNYRLDGLPVPAGSYVTVTGPNATTITLPSGTITADKTAPSGYVFTVSGIKDKAGNALTTYVANITLQADAKPVLNSGVVNADGTLTVGFNADVVGAATVTNASDIIVKANSSTLTFLTAAPAISGAAAGGPTQYTITDGTGADAGKYVVTAYDATGNVYELTNATSLSVATAGITAPGAGHIIAGTTLGAALKASITVTVK